MPSIDIVKILEAYKNKLDSSVIFSCFQMTQILIFWALKIICKIGFFYRPRLGAAFHKVLFVGGVYFISSTIEGCYRALNVSIKIGYCNETKRTNTGTFLYI